ncbi:Na+/H+ antiporter [Fervidobacterium pennivorans DSM 9078]|jgi:Na+/H+ antiporter NhaC|uniref:Na+/H+ antiporter n=1 Tax=Fervidobacterium pennivorans (strain DSM 9078 / Ven5) TaxID=771875 RepID=H9UCK1_FERPD|nr:Na+/H+ antiporter NhaC family protein [Fervidobacterium pennivorans]AFG35244.1 Na+/H+ antiporter [Fervidobacterium pennivorans DSM 9078]QIV78393.1 Na+/H+ antiporter NhaC family protein [Fervidobacterium pennivorans subsp. keratinolyticus]
MEHYGWLSLLPPVITVALALLTKEVIFSLFTGVFVGYLIVNGWNPVTALIDATDGIANSLNDGWNIRIILFCALLGAFVGLMQATGAASAFGKWMASKVKSRKGTLIITWLFGIFIFIDDYFNSLTIGTVMRPVTDEQKISRAKLAYILDSTAAPVSVLAPISSWVVTIMSIIKGSDGFSKLGVSEFTFFILLIPINLYAILAILMVLQTILRRDFGPMAKSENRALKGLGLYNAEFGQPTGEVKEGIVVKERARAIDMILPILVLVGLAVIFFPITTYLGAIDGENIHTFSEAVKSMTLKEAFNNTDASKALFYASLFTLVFASIYFMLRGLLTIQKVGEAIVGGIKSMVPALVILTLAWTIGTVIKSSPEDGGLGLSKYLAHVVTSGGFPLWALPVVVFIIAAAISFATGTSWGTFAIMIPIAMPIAIALAEKTGANLLNSALITVGASIGGAIFGDHCSPISDTTILSSTGAGCPHLEHVATQMPYATFVMVISALGYLIAGIFNSPVAGFVSALIVFFIAYEVMIRVRKPVEE